MITEKQAQWSQMLMHDSAILLLLKSMFESCQCLWKTFRDSQPEKCCIQATENAWYPAPPHKARAFATIPNTLTIKNTANSSTPHFKEQYKLH